MYKSYDWKESSFQYRRSWTHSTGERRVERRCTLNGLMIVAVGTLAGLELRTRRLQIRILPRVLESQEAVDKATEAPSVSRNGGRLAFRALCQVEQAEECGRAEDDGLEVVGLIPWHSYFKERLCWAYHICDSPRNTRQRSYECLCAPDKAKPPAHLRSFPIANNPAICPGHRT